MRGHYIQQESTFFRKSLWDKIAVPFEGTRLAGDYKLWCDFYRHAELVGLEYPVAGFRHLAGQRSEDWDAYMAEARPALETLRQQLGWSKPSLWSSRARGAFRSKSGAGRVRRRYISTWVERARMRHSDAHWVLKEYN